MLFEAKIGRRGLLRAGAVVGAASMLPFGAGCATDATPAALGTIVEQGSTARAFDARGLAWILSPAEGRLDVADADGRVIQTLEGLAYPSAVAVDAMGRGWVVEAGTSTLALVDLDRSTTTRLGAGLLAGARDVAIESPGRVLVADALAHTIVRMDDRGNVLATLGTPVTSTLSTDEGALNGPRSVAIAHDGTVLVAEVGGRRITRLAPDGAWLETTVADLPAPRLVRVGPGDGRFAVADAVRGEVSVHDARGSLMATHRPACLAETLAFAPNGTLFISGRALG